MTKVKLSKRQRVVLQAIQDNYCPPRYGTLVSLHRQGLIQLTVRYYPYTATITEAGKKALAGGNQ